MVQLHMPFIKRNKPTNRKNGHRHYSLKRFSLSIVVIVLCVAFHSWGYHKGYYEGSCKRTDAEFAAKNAMMEDSLTKWIFAHSTKISLDTSREIARAAMKTECPLLLISVVSVESEFIPAATSNTGAIGLSQVMFGHWGRILIDEKIIKDKRDLYNIEASMRAGGFILNKLMKESGGDLPKTLSGYLGTYSAWYVNKIVTNLGSLCVLTGTV